MPHLPSVLEGRAAFQVYFPAVRPVLPSSTHLPAQPFSDPTPLFCLLVYHAAAENGPFYCSPEAAAVVEQCGSITSCLSSNPGGVPWLVYPVMGQKRPDSARRLIGKRYHSYIDRPPAQQFL